MFRAHRGKFALAALCAHATLVPPAGCNDPAKDVGATAQRRDLEELLQAYDTPTTDETESSESRQELDSPLEAERARRFREMMLVFEKDLLKDEKGWLHNSPPPPAEVQPLDGGESEKIFRILPEPKK